MTKAQEMPLVSVVIPTFNRAPVLVRSMKSVLAQTFSDFELIVVDDCSTDDTESRIAATCDLRVRYIRLSANKGAAAARNVGIEAAHGSFIAFQDSDDEWFPNKLEKQLELARSASPAETVIYSGFLQGKGATAAYMPHPGIKYREGDILSQLLMGNFVSTQTLFLKRDMLGKVGGFDERFPRFQDWELAIRLAEKFPFRLVDEPLVTLHHSPDAISEDGDAQAKGLALIFEKHARLFERFPGSRFRILTGLGLINLSSGKTDLAKQQFRSALSHCPRDLRGWSSFLFSWLIPTMYWRLRGGRRGPSAPAPRSS